MSLRVTVVMQAVGAFESELLGSTSMAMVTSDMDRTNVVERVGDEF